MKLLKYPLATTALVLSLGLFSTSASAICLGMACMYNKLTPLEAIRGIEMQVTEILEKIQLKNSGGAAGTDQESDKVIMDMIKEALKSSKEINANDKVDVNRNRANAYLKTARQKVKEGNLAEATESLQEAKKRFVALEKLLDLSQSDRASQQTHILDRK